MNLRKLIIVGAGGFGREVHAWATQHPGNGTLWEIAGFLDDRDANGTSGPPLPAGILGPVAGHVVASDALYLCGLGSPEHKRRVLPEMVEKGAEFLTLIHPTCVIGRAVSLGTGVVLCPQVVLTSDIVIGDFVMFNTHATAGHDVRVGACSTISSFCDLTGGVVLGEDVFLASRVSIVPGKKVGNGAYVGAGSVVLQNVREGQRVFGMPARPL